FLPNKIHSYYFQILGTDNINCQTLSINMQFIVAFSVALLAAAVTADPVLQFNDDLAGKSAFITVPLPSPRLALADLFEGTHFKIDGKVLANSFMLKNNFEAVVCDLHFNTEDKPQVLEVSDKKPFIELAPREAPIDLTLAEIRCFTYMEDKK
ncbi:hypothetical protein BUE80_DR008869, partial [Diplocarpon rosae]